MPRNTPTTKTAKAPAKAAAKGKAAPAKNTKGAVAAKGKNGKTAKPVQEQGALVLAPARVKWFINSHMVNSSIEEQLGQFDDDNKKVLNNTAIAKIEQDEEKVKEYVTLLTRPKAPPKLAKEEREKWEAKQHAAHAKKVEAALKSDANLRAFKKKFDANTQRLAISRHRKRFSRDSYYAIAAIIQEVIRELLVCAMDEVLDCEKKIVVPGFCVTDAVQSTKYYCLVANMKTFRETYEKSKPKDEEEENEEEENEEEPAEEGQEEHVRGFQFYVEKIGKSITNSGEKRGKYSAIRLSKQLKKFCSDLIIDMLQGLADSLEQFLELKGAKTINADLIKTVFAGLMTYNHGDAEGLLKIVDEKLSEIQKEKENKKPAPKAAATKGKKAAAASEESDEAEETEAVDEDEDDADEDDEEPTEPAPRGRAKGKARA